jgi:hypothetical protein
VGARKAYWNASTMLAGSIGAVFLSVWSAQAGDSDQRTPSIWAPNLSAPAVDGINGKIAGFGGSAGHRSIYGAEGSLQFPVGYQYGFQLDPRVGRAAGGRFAEIGAHLFWRNPGAGLLGLYVNYAHLDRFGGVDAGAVAGEGELYWGRWTIQGIVGVSFGNSASQTTTTTSAVPSGGATLITTNTFTEGYDIKTRFFDQINFKYYILDNWLGYVGHRYLGGKHALALGSEFVIR